MAISFSDGEPVSVIGVKIYYADGSIVKIPIEKVADEWGKAPPDGVQVVLVFYQRTYGFDNRHYVEKLTGRDFYYWSVTHGFGAWPVPTGRNEPAGIPLDAVVKTGSLLEKQPYLAITNAAWNDFFWP